LAPASSSERLNVERQCAAEVDYFDLPGRRHRGRWTYYPLRALVGSGWLRSTSCPDQLHWHYYQGL